MISKREMRSMVLRAEGNYLTTDEHTHPDSYRERLFPLYTQVNVISLKWQKLKLYPL